MKVLVIYDLVPEETKVALVDMSEKEYEYFKKAHTVYINASDNEEGCVVSNVISNAFCEDPTYKKYCETDEDRLYFGKWKNNEWLSDISKADKLIRSGFIL